VSYVQPDIHHSGKLVACRVRSESDVWKFPIDGTPVENTQAAVRITRQSGQVQVPSVSPDGREIVYLSDHGGHANLWVARTDGTATRQITFERDPDTAVGVPQWAPGGKLISYIVSKGPTELWTIAPDGRGPRQVVPRGFSAAWSPDGEWLYYVPILEDRGYWRIDKISIRTGQVVTVRDEGLVNSPAPSESALYFVAKPHAGSSDWEIRRASPEDGESVVLGSVPGGRLPLTPLYSFLARSPDDGWLAMALVDGATTNIWRIPTSGGQMSPVTDFADRPTLIARQISWSPDSRFIYAAAAELRADVIVLDRLL